MSVDVTVDWSIFSGRKADKARAERYLAHLDAGLHWADISGRRLEHDSTIITIPVGRRFRITLDTKTSKATVQTHEAYNGTKPR